MIDCEMYFIGSFRFLESITFFPFECIKSTPPLQAGHDKRSICKRSTTGLKTEFSVSFRSCCTKAEEPLFALQSAENREIHAFSPEFSLK